ncbi:P-loop NTPase [Listeria sp. PSOL-1]|uniref:P-loop NTPase n=1 Tax=Listeria sp. PSOL-1 TaxID=1844999 RepID=UPI0013D6F52A|nr:P-loop NTPase [Listeria sp. PSOL-1]
MLNEQQITRLLYRLSDPVLEMTLEETEGVLDIEIISSETVRICLALADPEIATAEFTKNIKELIGQFGFAKIDIELEYLPSEVIDRIYALKDNILSETSQTKFIAVASGKGGVGKSTITANLAVALAQQGKKVGVLDADIYGFSIPVLMGDMTAPKKENGIIIPGISNNVKVISMDFFINEGEPVIWRGPMLGKMIKMFLEDVQWGELDYLLLDLPPGTGDVALDIHTLIPACHEIIVTTPHQAAAMVAIRAGYMAQKNNHTLLGVVENMSYLALNGENYPVFGEGGGEKVAEMLETELLIQIPISQPSKNKKQYTSAIYQKEEIIGQAYQVLAQKLSNLVFIK